MSFPMGAAGMVMFNIVMMFEKSEKAGDTPQDNEAIKEFMLTAPDEFFYFLSQLQGTQGTYQVRESLRPTAERWSRIAKSIGK